MTRENQAAVGANTDQNSSATEVRSNPAPMDAAAIQVAVDAETTRSLTITNLVRQHGLEATFGEQLIRDKVSLDAARARILDKLAEQAPTAGASEVPAQARQTDAREASYRDAATVALMHRYDPGKVKLSDDAREFRGMKLLDLAKDALGRRGVNVRGMSQFEVATAAFEMRSAGMHSTSDFPAILANVANKTLRQAYEGTTRTFTSWARRTTITDFKPVTRNQLGGAPDLLKVSESGEFKYGTMGEKKETYALLTYGRIMALTRQTIINDDLDAFTRIPAAFGAAASDLESDIVYKILTTNGNMADGVALFHASHGNLLTGAAITETSLSAAVRGFANQKGIAGRAISVLPKYIIVPPGPRSVEARKQVAATTPVATADVNVFAGSFEVVEEPRLIPATGTDPWFLAADSGRIDTIEFAYLEGQDGVFTETRNGFNIDGMEIKARHDFAAAAVDWLGLAKNPGA